MKLYINTLPINWILLILWWSGHEHLSLSPGHSQFSTLQVGITGGPGIRSHMTTRHDHAKTSNKWSPWKASNWRSRAYFASAFSSSLLSNMIVLQLLDSFQAAPGVDHERQRPDLWLAHIHFHASTPFTQLISVTWLLIPGPPIFFCVWRWKLGVAWDEATSTIITAHTGILHRTV